MTVWRYRAVVIDGPARGIAQRGELAGESAVDVRAALRRVGLQAIEVRPARSGTSRPHAHLLIELQKRLHGHLRSRRRERVSELYDSLATMLESGMPLLESLDTVQRSIRGKRSSIRSMIATLRESLRGGSSLSQSMEHHQGWFDRLEIAMVRAGQHAGDLPLTLRRLAERNERTNELQQKLIGALTYPVMVGLVGLGVVVFLSTKTLPDLVQILTEAQIETPLLTAHVIAFGQFVAHFWMVILLGTILAPLVVVCLRSLLAKYDVRIGLLSELFERLTPSVWRRIAVANVAMRLAELTRSGVPIVDALHIIAPTAPRALRVHLESAAAAVERGDDLPTALGDERWFDAEFRQLLAIGQTTGELDALLERIAKRYARRAARLIDRLATLLEPAVILALAGLVGLVVMAAILPLVRLQEIL